MTGSWLFLVYALGILCSCAAQKTHPQGKAAHIRDFSRFFGLQTAATNDEGEVEEAGDEGSVEEQGFVQPLDFSALLGGQDGGATHGFFRQPQDHRPFGAQSSQFNSGLKPLTGKPVFQQFGETPLPLFGNTNAEAGFRPEDFIKSKRGAGTNQQNSFLFFDKGQQSAPLKAAPTRPQRQPVRKANQEAEAPFDEDEGFQVPETEDEPLFANEDESGEEVRAKAASAQTSRPAKENKYPKYSSYYHATPKEQAQEEKPVEDDVDDIEKDEYENPFASAEDDDLGVKGDDVSAEDDEPLGAQLGQQQQTKTYPTKYAAAYTAPKNARPVASSTNKQKAAYVEDPFFEDPSEFPAIKIPGNKGKSGALQREPSTGYVDRTIRPAQVKYGNFEKVGRKPFRPSPPDPLYGKAIAGIPSYDFDHSPSAEYREAHLKPKRVEYSRSAKLIAPSHDGRRAASSKKANCKKIEKQISQDPENRFRRDAMTCFVCDDPTSGGKYEQCAYGSEPRTQAYYVGRSQQFRTADKDRKRRYLKYKPYPSLPTAAAPLPVSEEVAHKRKTRQEHDDGFSDGGFSYDPESALDDKDDYRFGPEYFTHDGDADIGDGESAQLKAAESTKSDTPENCKKVVKDEMICLVCKESKTGGNYEQCSYGSEPTKSSYSYGKTKSYGTPKKPYTERHRRYIAKGNGASKQPTEKFGGQKVKVPVPNDTTTPKRKRDDDVDDDAHSDLDEDLPKEIAESSEPITGEVEISENVPRKDDDPEFDFDEFDKKPENDGKAEATEHKEPSTIKGKQPKYDDYFSFLFPEYSETRESVKKAEDTEDPFDNEDDDHYTAESKDLTTDFLVPDFFSSAEPNKKDLEKMLGEFTQKDRSECKKIMKDQMTCFQCVDAKGMQHEECMFVAASEPKTSHMAYHESKEFKMSDPKKKVAVTVKTPGNDSTASPSAETVKTTAQTTTQKPAVNRNRGNKKHESVTTTSTTSAPSTTAAPEKKGRKRDTKSTAALSRRTRGIVPVDPPKRQKVDQKKDLKEDPKEDQTEEQSEDSELEVEEEVPETEDVEAGSAAVAATAAEKLSNGETPPEFKPPEGPEGMYSEDTKPVYDKRLQLSLPKYMLSKSEHEAIFDEVLASGS